MWGPMPDGRIEDRQVERLKEMGQWLARYGDGVYGTRGGPFKPGKWGASTCKENRIYLVRDELAETGPRSNCRPWRRRSPRPGCLAAVRWTSRNRQAGISVDVPASDRDDVATVIELTVDGTAFDIAPVDVAYRSDSLAYGKKADRIERLSEDELAIRSAEGLGRRLADTLGRLTAAQARLGWRSTWPGLGRSCEFRSTSRPNTNASSHFSFSISTGRVGRRSMRARPWGPGWSTPVAPVTAQRFRLNILKATDGPTIWEFHLGGAAE